MYTSTLIPVLAYLALTGTTSAAPVAVETGLDKRSWCFWGWGFCGTRSTTTSSSVKPVASSTSSAKSSSVKVTTTSSITSKTTSSSATASKATSVAPSKSAAPTSWAQCKDFNWDAWSSGWTWGGGYNLAYVQNWYEDQYGFAPPQGMSWNQVSSLVSKFGAKTTVPGPKATSKYSKGCNNPWTSITPTTTAKVTKVTTTSTVVTSTAKSSASASSAKSSIQSVASSAKSSASSMVSSSSAKSTVPSSSASVKPSASSATAISSSGSASASQGSSSSSVAPSSAPAGDGNASASASATPSASVVVPGDGSGNGSVSASSEPAASASASASSGPGSDSGNGSGSNPGNGSGSNSGHDTASGSATPSSSGAEPTGAGNGGDSGSASAVEPTATPSDTPTSAAATTVSASSFSFSHLVKIASPLTVQSASASPSATIPATPAVNGYAYGGCAQEVVGRLLDKVQTASSSQTIESCTALCMSHGFGVAGLEYGSECYCGNIEDAEDALLSGECYMPCSGDSNQICGGPNAINWYYNPDILPATVELPQGWTTYGVVSEAHGARTLTHQLWSSPSNTIESCAQGCADAGFLVSGTEYSAECYCGNGFSNGGGALLDDSAAFMLCSGDLAQKCGGPSVLSVVSALGRNIPQI